jgi:hypothetical protein
MAVTQSGTSVTGGDKPPVRISPFRRIWLWSTIAALVLGAAAIVVTIQASAYQPLRMWGLLIGCPYGVHCGEGTRTVNTFGAQTGEFYIPPQHGTFAVSVSLTNSGPFAVTIEAVSMRPPHPGYPWALTPAGPALYWTIRMTTGNPDPGLPIAGRVLKPGDGVYVAIPVQTPRCYLPRAWQVLDDFYVKERFGPFTKWARIPMMQPMMPPLLLHAPAEPPKPAHGVICSGRQP